jgi:hypothetical protein
MRLKGVKFYVVAVLAVLVAANVLAFAMVPYYLLDDFTYAGRDTFATEEDYSVWRADFKSEVVAKDGALITFSVLSTEPPIHVSWEVGVSYGQDFPLGEALDSAAGRIILTILGCGATLIASSLALVGLLTIVMPWGDTTKRRATRRSAAKQRDGGKGNGESS